MRRLLLVMVAACGDGDGAVRIPDADVSNIDAPLTCTHVQDLRLIRLRAVTFGTTRGAFDGMACIEGRSDLACATANGNDEFEMCAPTGEFGLRFVKDGYEKTVYLHGPGMFMPPGPFTIGDDAFVSANIWTPAGGTYPPTTNGNLVVLVTRTNPSGPPSGLANAEVAVLPSAGLTVRYLTTTGAIDPGLTATTATGVAVVANAPAGDIDIQVNSSSHPSCAFDSGGYGSPDNTQDARVEIVAGATIIVPIRCMP